MRAQPIFSGLAFFVCSCTAEVSNPGKAPDYFSLDSLIEVQVERLTVLNPKLEKSAILDGQRETKDIHHDSVGWENELKVFRDANIDKPAYYGYYNLKTAQSDKFSNLLFDEYSVRDDNDVPVKSLKIFYLDVKEALKKIEVVVIDKNELFNSERHLLMNFDNRQGSPLLSSYLVKGGQKLKFNEEVSYEMNGKLIF